MTNPNDAVGTNGAFGGRTSVNAFNDGLAAYSTRGVISGWDCVPNSGLTVSVGGTSGVRDVAAALDANGNFTTINNISGSPVDVTMPAAPASNKRIDLVVAYVDNPPQGTSTDTDNAGACGIITVSGTAAANPTPPTDANIRSAITADGASGSTAYYVILAKITITSGTTDIDATMIESGVADLGAEFQGGKVGTQAIQNNAVTASKIDGSTFDLDTERVVGTLNGTTVYEKIIEDTITMPSTGTAAIPHGITGLNELVSVTGAIITGTANVALPATGAGYTIYLSFWTVTATAVNVYNNGFAVTDGKIRITLRYTKS